jgi:peptidoglycan/LPS O-acetylase OafA/YrhL
LPKTKLPVEQPPLSHLRIPALDGLRGIAIIAVLLCHLSYYFPTANICKTILQAGWCGVDLFFVLSGFLITGILLDTRDSSNYFRAFYARRILRIFPIYYATLITVLVAARFIPQLDPVLPLPHDRVFYFFYLNNWWVLLRDVWHANIIGHFWSLAVEEQFYLLWPFIVWRLAPKQTERAALCGIVLAPIIRIAVYVSFGGVRDLVENPFCRMDSLLMGSLLASLVRRHTSQNKWQPVLHWLSIFTAVAIIAGGFSSLVVLRLMHSPLFISSGLTVVFGGLVSIAFLERNSARLIQRILRSRALTFCGKYSYGMYVYHVPLLWLVARFATGLKPATNIPHFLLLSGSVIALTIALAKVSFDYFETAFLKLKSKFEADTAV